MSGLSSLSWISTRISTRIGTRIIVSKVPTYDSMIAFIGEVPKVGR